MVSGFPPEHGLSYGRDVDMGHSVRMRVGQGFPEGGAHPQVSGP